MARGQVLLQQLQAAGLLVVVVVVGTKWNLLVCGMVVV